MQEWGKAFSRRTRKSWEGLLVETGSAAAVDGLQIRVSVSIESVTRTNIHPKINFLLFLFL